MPIIDMPYLLLIVFWTGVCLLAKKAPFDLKMRAGLLSGRGRKKGVSKRSLFAKLKAKLLKDAVTREIYESLGYIKNIAILGRSSGYGAQVLLAELADISVRLKPVYEEMARYLSTGDKEKAKICFSESTGTGISQGFGELLAGWDEVDPKDVLETLQSYIDILREERITMQKRKNEILSDLIYFPVVVNCMLVLLDFIYVAFFAGQQGVFTVLP